MAILMSRATGNFLTSTTWGLIDNTSYNNSESATTALTTSYQASSGSTTGAITCDGIAVKLSVRTGTTGTISVHLAIAGVEVTGTLVTINTADLPVAATADLNGGWIFFEFATPVLLVGATSYTVEAKTSSASMVSLFSTTGANWARALCTTTNQAPAAGDDLIVCGEYTGADTSNSFTVTMDETATTDYGSATTSLVTPSLAICSKGTLQYGVTAATAYYLKQSGSVVVYSGGTLNIGTTGTKIPRDSSAVLEFDPAADGDMGLVVRNLGTFNAQGLSRTSGKDIFATVLNANAAADATTLTVLADTGWLDNDDIVIASTTQTPGQTEKGKLNGAAGASSLTVDGFAGAGGGVLNAHGGVAPVIGEVINLTRNVVIRSATSTIMAYIAINPTSQVDIDWAEFYYIGTTVSSKSGFVVSTTTGSFSMQYSSLHDCEDIGVNVNTATGSIVNSNNVYYNLCSLQTSGSTFFTVAATSGAHTFVNNYFVGCKWSTNGSTSGFNSLDAGSTYSGLVFAGCSGALNVGRIFEASTLSLVLTNIVSHSNSGNGFSLLITGGMATVSGGSFWRNAAAGFAVSTFCEVIFSSVTAFGNATYGISSSGSALIILRSCVIYGGTTLVQTNGIAPTAGDRWFCFGCTFGSPSAHSTSDIVVLTASQHCDVTLINTILATATEVGSQSNLHPSNGAIRSHKHDAIDGTSVTYKSWYRVGTIQQETTIRHTASGFAWKMTPTSSTLKLRLLGPAQFDTFKAAVVASAAVTITAWVYKDSSYNGNAPRLVVVGGIVSGVGSAGVDDTDSLTVAHSNWEQLSVAVTPSENGVVEWYVDCDGTAGNAYVDDMGVSQA